MNTKNVAYLSIFKGLFLIFILGLLLQLTLPPTILSMPKFIVLVVTVGVTWFVYLTLAIPRCHKCGYGVFSILEIKRVPIIVKSWVSDNCSNCGVELK